MGIIGNANKPKDVFVQSNTSNLFQAFLQTYEKEDITLTSDISIEETVINVSSGHGITAGQFLIIYNDNYHWQVEVKSVTNNAITLFAPAYLSFTVAETTIIRGSVDLNAATLNIDYKFILPGVNQDPVDLTKAVFVMNHTAQGDSSKFGGINALTNGLLIRRMNGITFNLGVYRTNNDFTLRGGTVSFPDNAPAGQYATEINFVFQGQENFDQVIRIESSGLVLVKRRDDLSGLTLFRISIIGSYTSGE